MHVAFGSAAAAVGAALGAGASALGGGATGAAGDEPQAESPSDADKPRNKGINHGQRAWNLLLGVRLGRAETMATADARTMVQRSSVYSIVEFVTCTGLFVRTKIPG
jgi:hypothetical protein